MPAASQRSPLLAYAHAVLNLLFPRICAVCENLIPDEEASTVCPTCWLQVEAVKPPLCPTCGQPLRDPPRLARCTHCPQGDVFFAQARSAVRFTGPVVAGIHDYKFGFHRANHTRLGHLLNEGYDRFYANRDIGCIVAVPLHPAREREREFNQSALLAEDLHAHSGLPLALTALRRRRNTRPQSRQQGIARLDNIRDAFIVPDGAAVRGQRILLVDDVYTSGSTVNECARTLREAGVDAVFVLTVARAG